MFLQLKMTDRKIETAQLAAQEILTAPGFQKLRQDLLQDVNDLKSQREGLTNTKRKLETQDDIGAMHL